MPFSRLHAKPRALYKAVVDATTDDERAAAVAAVEEYEGSNGVCYDCRLSYLKDPEKQKTRIRPSGRNNKEEKERRAAKRTAAAAPST